MGAYGMILKNIHEIVTFCGRYAYRIRLAYPVSFLKSVFTNLKVMVAIYMIGQLAAGTGTVMMCVIAAALMIASFALQALLEQCLNHLQSATGYEVFAEKRMELGAHLRSLPMGYFTEGNIGRISTVLSNDMAFVEENAMKLVAEVASDIFSQIVLLGFLICLHPLIGLTAGAFALIAVILGQFMSAGAFKNGLNRQDANESMTGAVLEYIEGIGVVKAFHMEGKGAKRLRDAFRESARVNLHFEAFLTPWQGSLMIVYGAGMAATLAMSVWLFERGRLEVSAFIGVMLFLFNIYGPVMHLYQQGSTLTVMRACLHRIRTVFSEKPLADEGKKKVPAQAEEEAEIAFDHVSFAYDTEDVLHDVSFTLKKGETVALVGESGGGKTTIASLLARFWDIREGSVRYRGVDIRDMALQDLMGQISMVFQNVYLFEDTVYQNIAMGRQDAAREEVITAAKKARCYDFIMELPYGFDTVIGEGGATLSGGEAQRISIARCILKDAPVVILDEATASVDADNEHHIQMALSDLCRGKTVIVIAHRLNTIRNADRILVISKGRIIEQGTHEALTKTGGYYHRMTQANTAAFTLRGKKEAV